MSKPPTNPSTAVAKPTSSDLLAHIEELAKKYALSACETKGRFERALVLAEGMEALRQAVKPILPKIYPLMDSPLGFLTDRKGKEPYSESVILDCHIEATLRGHYPVGNEFNILAGKMYCTKEGYSRLVRELPGLTDLHLQPGVPKMCSSGAIVPYKATWKINGIGYSLIRELPVRLNSGMGVDGAIGKATRKMLAAIYSRCTGSFLTEGDAEGDELPVLPPARPQPGNGVSGPPRLTEQQKNRMAVLVAELKIGEGELKQLASEFGAPDGDVLKLTLPQAEALENYLEDLRAAEMDGHDPVEVPA